jgi:methyl coenzyme M reductase subunit D
MVQGTKVITLSNQIISGSKVITISNQGVSGSMVVTISNQVTFTKSLADSITLADSNVRVTARALRLSIAENTILITDSIIRQPVYQRTISDVVSFTDINSKAIETTRGDTTTLSDVANTLFIIGGKLLADTLLSDDIGAKEISKVLSDNLVFTDNLSSGGRFSISDLITISDSITGKVINKVIFDSIGLVDAQGKLIAIVPEDGYTFTDTAYVSNTLQQILVDNISITDAIISAITTQPTTPRRRHKCSFLDALRKGLVFFNFVEEPIITEHITGNTLGTHLPSPSSTDHNDSLTVTDSAEDLIKDLGEHKK